MHEDKRLLILGSNEDFVKLTQCAVRKGVYTVVVDPYHGEAKKYATKSYTANLDDDAAIDQIVRVEKIDHIFTTYSDNLFEIMVRMSARYGLPSFCPLSKVRYLRDKMQMKKMFRELGIASAKGQTVDANVTEAQIRVAYPCALKPIDGWGSKGMKIIHNYSELAGALEASMSYSSSGSVAMLEEINMGYEINVMSWVKDGRIYFVEFGDRETSDMTTDKLPHLSREVFPTIFYRELEDRVKDILGKVAAYCEIKEGPLSMQFFYEDGEITVGEVAGRFFGLGQGIVPVINGIDLNELVINMLYFPGENDRLVQREALALDHCSIAMYIYGNKGIIRDLGNVMDFYDPQHCDEYHVYMEPNHAANQFPWILRVYAHFGTRAEADAYTDRLYRGLFVPDLEGRNLVRHNALVVYGGKRWPEVRQG